MSIFIADDGWDQYRRDIEYRIRKIEDNINWDDIVELTKKFNELKSEEFETEIIKLNQRDHIDDAWKIIRTKIQNRLAKFEEIKNDIEQYITEIQNLFDTISNLVSDVTNEDISEILNIPDMRHRYNTPDGESIKDSLETKRKKVEEVQSKLHTLQLLNRRSVDPTKPYLEHDSLMESNSKYRELANNIFKPTTQANYTNFESQLTSYVNKINTAERFIDNQIAVDVKYKEIFDKYEELKGLDSKPLGDSELEQLNTSEEVTVAINANTENKEKIVNEYLTTYEKEIDKNTLDALTGIPVDGQSEKPELLSKVEIGTGILKDKVAVYISNVSKLEKLKLDIENSEKFNDIYVEVEQYLQGLVNRLGQMSITIANYVEAKRILESMITNDFFKGEVDSKDEDIKNLNIIKLPYGTEDTIGFKTKEKEAQLEHLATLKNTINLTVKTKLNESVKPFEKAYEEKQREVNEKYNTLKEAWTNIVNATENFTKYTQPTEAQGNNIRTLKEKIEPAYRDLPRIELSDAQWNESFKNVIASKDAEFVKLHSKYNEYIRILDSISKQNAVDVENYKKKTNDLNNKYNEIIKTYGKLSSMNEEVIGDKKPWKNFTEEGAFNSYKDKYETTRTSLGDVYKECENLLSRRYFDPENSYSDVIDQKRSVDATRDKFLSLASDLEADKKLFNVINALGINKKNYTDYLTYSISNNAIDYTNPEVYKTMYLSAQINNVDNYISNLNSYKNEFLLLKLSPNKSAVSLSNIVTRADIKDTMAELANGIDAITKEIDTKVETYRKVKAAIESNKQEYDKLEKDFSDYMGSIENQLSTYYDQGTLNNLTAVKRGTYNVSFNLDNLVGTDTSTLDILDLNVGNIQKGVPAQKDKFTSSKLSGLAVINNYRIKPLEALSDQLSKLRVAIENARVENNKLAQEKRDAVNYAMTVFTLNEKYAALIAKKNLLGTTVFNKIDLNNLTSYSDKKNEYSNDVDAFLTEFKKLNLDDKATHDAALKVFFNDRSWHRYGDFNTVFTTLESKKDSIEGELKGYVTTYNDKVVEANKVLEELVKNTATVSEGNSFNVISKTYAQINSIPVSEATNYITNNNKVIADIDKYIEEKEKAVKKYEELYILPINYTKNIKSAKTKKAQLEETNGLLTQLIESAKINTQIDKYCNAIDNIDVDYNSIMREFVVVNDYTKLNNHKTRLEELKNRLTEIVLEDNGISNFSEVKTKLENGDKGIHTSVNSGKYLLYRKDKKAALAAKIQAAIESDTHRLSVEENRIRTIFTNWVSDVNTLRDNLVNEYSKENTESPYVENEGGIS